MGERRVTRDGRILEKQADGTVIEVGRQQGQQGAIPIGPRSGAPQQRDRDNARQDRIDAEARAAREQAAYDRQQALEAEMTAKGFMRGPDGQWVVNPTFTPPASASDQKERRDRIGRLNSLVAQINRTQELGDTGPLATSGFGAIADYNPFSSDNARFDTAGASLSQQGLAAFKVPGTGTVSDRDAIMFDRANLPQSSTLDASNQEVMRGLRGRVEEEYNALGLPAPNWVRPLDRESAPRASVTAAAGSFGNAITGNTRMRQQNDPETAARAKQAWLSGASYDQVNQIFKDAGYPGISIGEWNAVEPWRKKGRGKEIVWETRREVPMSRAEELAGSPTGAFLAGIANAGSFGGVQALAPEQMQAIQAMNPKMSLTGEVIGSIGGTSMLGRLGSGAAKKFAPELGEQVSNRLMQALPKLKPETIGRMGSAARGIGTDATYAGIYGENTGQGALPSAGFGALGSVGGRVVGSATGKFIGGIGGNSMRELSDMGLDMTPGQMARASLEDTPSRFGVRKMIAGLEDSVANTPVLNASVGSARQRSFEQGNQAIFREAAGGAPIDNFGPQALEDLYQLKNRAYDDAAQGVSIPLDDPRLIEQLGDANQYGLGQDFARGRKDFATSMDQSFAPILGDGPNINGRQLQDSLRYTQGEQRVWNQAAGGAAPDPSARGIGNAFGKVNDAMVSAAARNAPGAIPKLKIANRLNRNLSVMDNATGAAAAEGGLASPMQVINAIKSNNTKFGAGRGQRALEKSPLYQTAAKLQAILPNKAPPTGVNAAPMLAILGAGAAGTGQATDSSSLSGLGGLLLASLAYTKLGSKGLNAALIKRPKALKALGSAVSKRKGLFGAASVPLMLESGN